MTVILKIPLKFFSRLNIHTTSNLLLITKSVCYFRLNKQKKITPTLLLIYSVVLRKCIVYVSC